MRPFSAVFAVLAFAAISGSQASFIGDFLDNVLGALTPDKVKSVKSTCAQISKAVSNASQVFLPGDTTGSYTNDNLHYATSSSQPSVCSVEPGTAKDVGIILQILGKNKTPFAVKGGGHALNPGSSSTKGVQISMTRFKQVTYNAKQQTADIGAGLVWDEVYAALAPHNVVVVGGRVTGVGVAGLILGGGYSWLTNQHGLAIDNIDAFELVLPSGSIKTVNQKSNPDLFFALRGGYNNFGIVTRFTLKTYPQGQVWGGVVTVLGDYFLDQVNAAILKYTKEVTDPKAALLPAFTYITDPGILVVSLILFYDGPTPPTGIFDDFLAIPNIGSDVSTRSYLSLVQASPSDATIGMRGAYDTVPVLDYDQTLLLAVANETRTLGQKLASVPGSFISYAVEPFLPTILSHGSNSAYPFTRSKSFLPTNVYYAWIDESSDKTMYDTLHQSIQTLGQVAKAQGQKIDDAPLYGNYAIFSTPVSKIYGSNLAKLKIVKFLHDPLNVMGQAGGWKI